MSPLLERIFGANWRTTVTGALGAFTGFLMFLAALPYSFGEIADFFPPEWKTKVAVTAAIATAVLKMLNGIAQKDKQVTGGIVQQPDPAYKRDAGEEL